MIEAPLPHDEPERLANLLYYEILDTEAEQAFDDLTALAAKICETPIALVSLVDDERQWFKSRVGLGACETPRGVAFCSHAILDPNEVMIVSDARADERFEDNPIVTGDPRVIFYAGVPLVTPTGHALGTLCVIDHEPRELDEEQLATLKRLARQVVHQLEMRRAFMDLRELTRRLDDADQELRNFSSVAAQDLRAPLQQLLTSNERLDDGTGAPLSAQAEECLRFTSDAAQRMQWLISDLLALSRVASRTPECTSVDLRCCVDAALKNLAPTLDASCAVVAIDALPLVDGDAPMLTQLFQSLIANALKRSDGMTPRLQITCVSFEERLVFGVRDEGEGLPPEQLDKVFATPELTDDGEPNTSGCLGLCVARKAVVRHGGNIWVESEVGFGSHFRFTLPGVRKPSMTPREQQGSLA